MEVDPEGIVLVVKQKMLKAGNYLQNAGNFRFRAKVIVAAFAHYSAKYLEIVMESLDNGKSDLSFFWLIPELWSMWEATSIDYAIVGHAGNLVALSFADDWYDFGCWESLWQAMEVDDNGVAGSKMHMLLIAGTAFFDQKVAAKKLLGLD